MSEAIVDALIDTGFTSQLTLPALVITNLGLTYEAGVVPLADGSIKHFNVYKAELGWDGGWRTVSVYDFGQ